MAERDGFLAYIIAGREARCKSIATKCLLQYYCSNVGKGGTFYKSIIDICAETKVSAATVHRFNDGLKKLGVLSWVEGDNLRGLANVYTMNLPKLKELAETSKAAQERSKIKARTQSAERSRRYRERRLAAAASR